MDGVPVLQELGPNGRIEQERSIGEESLEIGRRVEGLAYPEDRAMADRHARVGLRDDRVEVSDSGDGSGVWLRVLGAGGRALREGDQIWLGSQLLVVRREGGAWRVRHHGADGRLRETHRVPDEGVFVGRSSEWTLDPSDTRLSRRHAQIVPDAEGLRLYDRGAHNGTYLKLRAPETLEDGSEFRVATRHFRLVRRAVAGEGAGARPAVPVSAQDESVPAAPVSAQDESVPAVPAASRRGGGSLAARLRRLGESGGESRRHAGAGAEDAAPADPSEAASSASVPAADEAPPVETPPPDVPPAETPPPDAGGAFDIERTVVSEPIGSTGALEESGTATSAADPGVSAGAGEPGPDATGSVAPLALLVIDAGEESVSMEVAPGTTILEAVQAAGLARGEPIDWECGDGRCGVCAVAIEEGAERLDPPDPASGEMKTIQVTEQVVPDPRRYRLACLARVRGTVRVRRLP